MADYQQALDAQQTRALQYQQAVNALEKAKQLTGLVNLDLNNIEDYHAEFVAQAEDLTDQVFELEQRLSVSDMAKTQFEKAFELVCKISGEIDACKRGKRLVRYFLPSLSKKCKLSKR